MFLPNEIFFSRRKKKKSLFLLTPKDHSFLKKRLKKNCFSSFIPLVKYHSSSLNSTLPFLFRKKNLFPCGKCHHWVPKRPKSSAYFQLPRSPFHVRTHHLLRVDLRGVFHPPTNRTSRPNSFSNQKRVRACRSPMFDDVESELKMSMLNSFPTCYLFPQKEIWSENLYFDEKLKFRRLGVYGIPRHEGFGRNDIFTKYFKNTKIVV